MTGTPGNMAVHNSRTSRRGIKLRVGKVTLRDMADKNILGEKGGGEAAFVYCRRGGGGGGKPLAEPRGLPKRLWIRALRCCCYKTLLLRVYNAAFAEGSLWAHREKGVRGGGGGCWLFSRFVLAVYSVMVAAGFFGSLSLLLSLLLLLPSLLSSLFL